MRVEKLGSERLFDFISYCKEYGSEHDGSFLYENDLKEFLPNASNPTYVLLDDFNKIIGAGSLMLEPRFTELRKGRIRILHLIKDNTEAYKLLLDALMQNTEGIDSFYPFIPEKKQQDVGAILEKLDFHILRYVWLLRRQDEPVLPPVFSSGMHLRPLRRGVDEQAWCSIINTCFANQLGHTHRTSSMIAKERESANHIEGGMQMLWDGNEPVGLVKIEREKEEEQEIAFIGPIAVLPQYQGRSLGRNLLRAGIIFGKEKGLAFTELTVSTENSKAADLYLSEGFRKEQVMICYNMKTNRNFLVN